MLSLWQLERDWRKASQDKSDLFDFYNRQWPFLLARIDELEQQVVDLRHEMQNMQELT